jgi:hypothetical protein
MKMEKNWFSENGKKFHLVGDGRSGPQIISLCKKSTWCIPFWCVWVNEYYFKKDENNNCQCLECARLEIGIQK